MLNIAGIEVTAVDWFACEVFGVGETYWIDECGCAAGEKERRRMRGLEMRGTERIGDERRGEKTI
jgi:hypothetical protein